MIYLYAIIDQPGGVLPSLTGLENAALSEMVYQDIAGVYTSLPANAQHTGKKPYSESTPLTATEENIWKHEAVLEILMLDHSVLPLRFGSTFAGESELLALLQEKYTGFSANLTRVQGCVELSLRVNWQNETNPLPIIRTAAQARRQSPTVSGKDYMQSLLQARQQEQALHQQIETQACEFLRNLNRLATENTHVVSLTPYPNLKAAYLIAQPKVPLFRQEVGNLAALHPDLRFALTGPWPPYNFVTN